MYCMIIYSDIMPRHIKSVAFEWDSGNVTKSWLKHVITKEECEEAFLNRPLRIFDDKKHSLDEIRFVAYGKTDIGKYLTIIFTLRSGKIRVISARKQNRKEGKAYDQKN